MHRGTSTFPPRTIQNHSSSAPNLNNSEFGSNTQSTSIVPSASPSETTSTATLSSATLNTLEITVTFLWLATPILASVSLINVIVAVATNSWLETEEKMRNPAYNGSVINDDVYLSKWTQSGLWRLCYTNRE